MWDDRFILFGFNKSIDNATKAKKPITYVSDFWGTLPSAQVRVSIRAHQTVPTRQAGDRRGVRGRFKLEYSFAKLAMNGKSKRTRYIRRLRKRFAPFFPIIHME